jgi:hypothetical protein
MTHASRVGSGSDVKSYVVGPDRNGESRVSTGTALPSVRLWLEFNPRHDKRGLQTNERIYD